MSMRFLDWLLADAEGGRTKASVQEGSKKTDPPVRTIVDEIFEATPATQKTTKEKAEQFGSRLRIPTLNIGYTNFILTVIAATLCAIAFKIFTAPTVPTSGDFFALHDLPPEERKEAHARLLKSIPLIRVKGGEIEITNSSIDVTGSEVSIVR